MEGSQERFEDVQAQEAARYRVWGRIFDFSSVCGL